MKKAVLWLAALLVTNGLMFFAGARVGSSAGSDEVRRSLQVGIVGTEVGHYVAYRDIALEIRKGDIRFAECHAELMATQLRDVGSRCMADSDCKRTWYERIRTSAPELVGSGPNPIESRNACLKN